VVYFASPVLLLQWAEVVFVFVVCAGLRLFYSTREQIALQEQYKLALHVAVFIVLMLLPPAQSKKA
jgi:hypothetical protein